MMRKLIRIYASAVIVLLLSVFAASSPVHAFSPFGSVCSNGGSTSAVCLEQQNGGSNPLTGQNGLFFGVSRIVAIIAGIASVIIIVIAGFRFTTSGGDPAKVKEAKSALVAALIGLVIIVLAASIISLVLSRI